MIRANEIVIQFGLCVHYMDGAIGLKLFTARGSKIKAFSVGKLFSFAAANHNN